MGCMDEKYVWNAWMGCVDGMHRWDALMGSMDAWMHGWDAWMGCIQVSFLIKNIKRCARVDFPPTGLYEQSFGLIPLDSYSFSSFHF